MSATTKIRPRDRDTIIQALAAGVVPRIGLQHVQVGRARELSALVRDVERVADGGSALRFVIGEYGAGKSFFMSLVRLVALEKRLLTVHADLGPDRRFTLRPDRRARFMEKQCATWRRGPSPKAELSPASSKGSSENS